MLSESKQCWVTLCLVSAFCEVWGLVLLIFSERGAVEQQLQTCNGVSAKQITPALHLLLLNHFWSWGSLRGSKAQCQCPGSSPRFFPAGVSGQGCLGCSGVSCALVDLSRSPHFFTFRGIRCLCVWGLLGYIRHCSNQTLPAAFPKSCCRDAHTLHTGITGHLVLFAGGFRNLKRWDAVILEKAWELALQEENLSGREIPRFVLCCLFPIGSTGITNIQLQAIKNN